MAYMIKDNYEPCDNLMDNKIRQKEVLNKALMHFKNKYTIVKNIGEIEGFFYIEFQEYIDDNQILKLKDKISSGTIGKLVYLSQNNSELKLRIPIILEKEQVCYILNSITMELKDLQGIVNHKKESAMTKQ